MVQKKLWCRDLASTDLKDEGSLSVNYTHCMNNHHCWKMKAPSITHRRTSALVKQDQHFMQSIQKGKMNKGDGRIIEMLHNKCLRRIWKIKWQDKVNHKSLERTGMRTLSSKVNRRRWKFIRHILRQDREKNSNMCWHGLCHKDEDRGEDQEQHRGISQKQKGHFQAGEHGTRPELQLANKEMWKWSVEA